MKGRVMRSTGSWYDIWDDTNKRSLACRLTGRMKLDKENVTNPVAVGDLVELELENEKQGIIKQVLPRSNYIARQSPKSRLHIHLIACNIDQAVLITSICEPPLKPGFIDRFLLTTEPQNIPVIIVFNKWDLYDVAEKQIYEEQKRIYGSIGYDVLAVSATTGFGIDELRSRLHQKISLFSGQSGVGKSSVINTLAPGLILKTSEVSSWSGKGMHTTTFAQMFRIEDESFLIDMPGIKTLGFNNLEIMDVAHNFREFFKASVDCRFGSQCTHRDEPGCAVKRELEEGSISDIRYRNYLNILDEIQAQNYWERNKKY
ncbi:MAG: ribosome small subunit-dependent GTPase A [Saprospiraceae bacterium]|nr:ribosome small subunit-dependent GTPase A [Saprospiraceae bacterium]